LGGIEHCGVLFGCGNGHVLIGFFPVDRWWEGPWKLGVYRKNATQNLHGFECNYRQCDNLAGLIIRPKMFTMAFSVVPQGAGAHNSPQDIKWES
jgi:hypothetical protein